MGVFSRWRRRKDPYAARTAEERIARYVYLLNSLPPGVVESAHESAFRDVPAAQRREMLEQLKPFMSESERASATEDPHVLATLVRRARERRAAREAADAGAPGAVATMAPDATGRPAAIDALDTPAMFRNAGVLHLVALNFVASTAVNSYFLYGAGSLVLGDQPAWIGDMVDPGSAGLGGGDFGGITGGDYGGMDAGGFGGGFDGGGGFG